jgi:hypothetical protein
MLEFADIVWRKESPHKIRQISKTASLNRYVFNCYIFLNISFKDSSTKFKVKQHIVGLQRGCNSIIIENVYTNTTKEN